VQQLFSEIRFTEIKADMMDDLTINRRVKHRIQLEVTSQRGSGTASLVVRVPNENCLEMDDDATIQAACCRLGLAIPGLHLRTRCLQNCTQMGPHAELTDSDHMMAR
jgi:hypothetical protein